MKVFCIGICSKNVLCKIDNFDIARCKRFNPARPSRVEPRFSYLQYKSMRVFKHDGLVVE